MHTTRTRWLARRPSGSGSLRALPLFRSCSDRELDLVARTTTKHCVPAGATLMHEGAVGREFLVILDGTADVIIDGDVVAELGPGDVAGEIALLDHRARTATVVARTDLVTLVSGVGEFAQLITGAPAVARALLVGMAARLREADRRVAA